MTVAQIQRVFRVIGKCVWFAQRGPEHADSFRKLMSAVADETVSGLASESEAITKFLVPFTTAINGVVRSLDGVPGAATKNAELYLKNQTAPALGLTAGASMTAIGTALAAELTTASQTVGAEFAAFFSSTWSITLPTSATPTIPDEWITADVLGD